MSETLGVKWRTYGDAAGAFRGLAEDVSATLSQARSQYGKAHLVLSGGNLPMQYLPILAASLDDWREVAVSLTDERWVPVIHQDSNESLVREHFLDLAPGVAFTGMMGLGDDLATDARLAADACGALSWPADISILGAAPDGHIASLFPGRLPALGTSPADFVIATKAPNGQARLSLSPEALLLSRRMVIVTSGADKRKALKTASLPGAVDACPARLLLNQDVVPVHIFDFD